MKYEGKERREHPEIVINRKVNFAGMIVIVLNIVTLVWFASAVVSAVEVNTSVVKLNTSRLDNTIERVIKLEALTSEQGRIIARMDLTLNKVNNTLTRIDREQAKRGPIVYGQDKK